MQCWECYGTEGREDGPSTQTLTDSRGNPIRPMALLPASALGAASRAVPDFMTWPEWDAMPSLARSEEHTSELQSLTNLVCRLLLEKKKTRSNGAELRVGAYETHAQRQPTSRPT